MQIMITIFTSSWGRQFYPNTAFISKIKGNSNHLEKEMATHSSILAWRIPWTEEPGGPQSMGSQRVGND